MPRPRCEAEACGPVLPGRPAVAPLRAARLPGLSRAVRDHQSRMHGRRGVLLALAAARAGGVGRTRLSPGIPRRDADRPRLHGGRARRHASRPRVASAAGAEFRGGVSRGGVSVVSARRIGQCSANSTGGLMRHPPDAATTDEGRSQVVDDGRRLLSVVCPAYQEEAVLPDFHRALADALAPLAMDYRIEIIYVDDGSRDRTLDVLRALA